MKIALFCKCGAGAEGEIRPDAAAEKFLAFWAQVHEGPEHGACDRAEAALALRLKHGRDEPAGP